MARAEHYMVRNLKEAFRKADTNGDGQLQFGEFCALLHKGNPQMKKKEMQLMFDAVKGDDNQINFDEFVDYLYNATTSQIPQDLSGSIEYLRNIFKQLDKDGSGYVSWKELRNYIDLPDGELFQLVKEVDNHDGRADGQLQIDEFVQLVFSESHKAAISQAISKASAEDIKRALEAATSAGLKLKIMDEAEIAMHRLNLDTNNFDIPWKDIMDAKKFANANLAPCFMFNRRP